MDLDRVRDDILLAALPHVAFDGWSPRTLRQAAHDAGYDGTMAELAFPDGPVALVEHFNRYADRKMAEALGRPDYAAKRLRDKVALAIRLRLEPWDNDREAVRRAIALLALPGHTVRAARLTYRTVDCIWRAIGDSAANLSFYTKRAMLAAVYSASVLYWLDDRSDAADETWQFVERRLDDVLQMPTLFNRLSEPLRCLPQPFRLFESRGRRRFSVHES
jgi:ubiquinone biosynthesis protein COQ9